MRRPIACTGTLVLCLLAAPAPAQDTVVPPPPSGATIKAWAELAHDVQVYERFRYWSTFQPPALRDGARVLEAYRATLVAAGSTPAEADKAIAIVREQGRALEIERWNRILTAETPRFNTNPNAFLVQMVQGRPAGAALDVGMGQGRNAIYLAQQGWTVTGFDPADRAVALAQETAKKAGVTIATFTQGDDEFEWGENRWDLIVLSYVAVRPNVERIVRALKPGGLVVIEGFHRDATKTRSIGGAVVFDSSELLRLFAGLRVRTYEDVSARADFGGEVTPLVRLCAEKP
jgi:protein-L-isoaspartate O-methyltransferase